MSAVTLVICCFDGCHLVIYLKGRQYSVSRIDFGQGNFDYPGLWCLPGTFGIPFLPVKDAVGQGARQKQIWKQTWETHTFYFYSHSCGHWFVGCVLGHLRGDFLLLCLVFSLSLLNLHMVSMEAVLIYIPSHSAQSSPGHILCHFDNVIFKGVKWYLTVVLIYIMVKEKSIT